MQIEYEGYNINVRKCGEDNEVLKSLSPAHPHPVGGKVGPDTKD